ncbi:carbohydrate esterase family 4 protein [Tilletiaria anomala UBC 951]|uniref:chitin deacetylase n=1 Tax=Tilletiaria anomala (strain ATCC 24038 / CBS 436.72 / UBC 951) TaxID=1037660 RepID=A0A066VWL1_TILAU|nr:carbohydrate esterase family 4 protein [Tilletiaria anomala UBC 951]KDN43204.1 carbohydrate esterase family 4 protein [Tilletiaria anomala UBC 951]
MRFQSTLIPLAACCTLAAAVVAQPVRFVKRAGVTWPAPFATPPRSMTPQPWIDALNAAVATGKIPSIPRSQNVNGPLKYPDGVNPADPSVCNWSYSQCEGPNDITSAPQGQVAINFDDGPSQGTNELLNFLQTNSQSATHFLIGSNILTNQDAFQQMAKSPLHHLADHTWSHPSFITALSNEDVVAEIGWCMEIIFQLSGKVPAFWRPPQGDADNRIRAIAEHVFGLTLVSWSGDSNDWELREGSGSVGDSPAQVCTNIHQAFGSLTSQGKGVLVLEHELTDQSVHAFEWCTWPLVQQFNLQARNIAQLGDTPGKPWYANALNNTAPVSAQQGILSMQRQEIIASAGSGNQTRTMSSTTASSLTISTSAASSASSHKAVASAAPAPTSVQIGHTSTAALSASRSSCASAAALLVTLSVSAAFFL